MTNICNKVVPIKYKAWHNDDVLHYLNFKHILTTAYLKLCLGKQRPVNHRQLLE